MTAGIGAADALGALVAARTDELVALRRHLHAHPEPSGQEHDTTTLLVERLEVAGLSPVVLPSGTGLVCDVGPGDGPPTVAVRGDIDALSMQDDKDVPYRSRRDGVAHACGHDVHTVITLGAGLALDEALRADAASGGPPRRVRLVFEPSEERVPGGAVEVVASGALDGIDAIFGLHCDPKLDAGLLGVRVGPLTSASDLVEIHLSGPGGHTARPHLTVDLVDVAARVVRELPTRVVELAGDPDLLLVFGAIAAGDAPNVIPTRAELRGSLRTPDREVWQRAADLLRDALAHVVGPTGAAWDLDHRRGVPPVVNRPRETELLAAAGAAVLGPGGVVTSPRSAGGDSFSWYLERTGGSYGRLGTHPPGLAERLDLHAGTFDVDESVIPIGAEVLARAAVGALDDPARGDDLT
ncbi:amidohydrolase [Dermatobacter hominis]|uniref:amidohydrolase n=1 Tax=Dermatobacter hominis TaxID=2884263 RepID=UPI001D10C219|nr:amidohydrolase [Dermatobacter hominis]UDY36905.1 amidohydrolase [Dermatobacter hominis]